MYMYLVHIYLFASSIIVRLFFHSTVYFSVLHDKYNYKCRVIIIVKNNARSWAVMLIDGQT